MSVITITRNAKCKDCRFCEPEYQGKRKFHVCKNAKSSKHTRRVTLKDLVCKDWRL